MKRGTVEGRTRRTSRIRLEPLYVKVYPQTKENLNQLADARGDSLAAVVNDILDNFFKKEEK